MVDLDNLELKKEVGPLTINFRVLLEPKGFLRIIILIVALLAFSVTAGFNSGNNANTVTCTSSLTGSPNYTGAVNFVYPYSGASFSFNVLTPDNFTNNNTECATSNAVMLAFSSSAQFFVAMGVVTIIYVLAALIIYMLFITPELFMAKWLVIGDFFATIAFALLYLVASIAWSAGAAGLDGYLVVLLTSFSQRCLLCTGSPDMMEFRIQPFTQPAVGALLGWLAAFIWFASVWFVYKDTVWHKDGTGPLSQLYKIQADKKGKSEEQAESGTTEENQE